MKHVNTPSSWLKVLLAAAWIGFHVCLPAQSTSLMPLTQSWRYSTNNHDGLNWQSPAFDDSAWSNPSPALLYIESATLPAPKNTLLPDRGDGYPRNTYYFRTTVNVADVSQFVALTFSNLLDDGAIFYLNGTEIQRVGIANTNITYDSLANRTVGDATAFDVFSISDNVLTNLVPGDNVLAVEVHQVTVGSTDIVFGSALLGVTNLTLTRGPYLQNGSHTNLTVRWRTDAAAMGQVRYGTSLADLNLSAGEFNPTNEHQVTLTNLAPDTKYFYAIGTATTLLAGSNVNHFFVTSPTPGTKKPTRVWVLGDSGTADLNQVNVRNAYESFTGAKPTDLWLMLGDNAYDNGTDAEYQQGLFRIYTNQLPNSVLWPTLGNHDTAQSTILSDNFPYFSIFTLPRNGEAGGTASGSEHYYSFDYANIHFICLDSMTTALRLTNSAMYIWLTNDLANVTADWTVVFFHHPPYSRGSHNSDSESELLQMRRVFMPVLEEAGVDLVLAGHSHSYERSFLLDRFYGFSTQINATNKLNAGSGRENGTGAYIKPEGGPVSHQGTVYAVAGSSGQISGGSLNHPAMFISLNNLGSMVLDFASNRLDAKFIRETGTTNDYFTILKVNYPPVASNLAANVSGDLSATLTLRGSDINRDEVFFVPTIPPARGVLTAFNPVTGEVGYTPAHGFVGADSFKFRAHDGQAGSPEAVVTLNVIPPLDIDGNGVPDYWENTFGLANLQADDDNDGLSNAQEYWVNSNPTNAASGLRILSLSRAAGGETTLTWSSIGGTRYRVSYRDGDAAGPFLPLPRPAYEELDPAPIGTAAAQSFTDDFSLTGGPPLSGARYYRVGVAR